MLTIRVQAKSQMEPGEPVEAEKYWLEEGMLVIQTKRALGLGGPWETRTSYTNLDLLSSFYVTESG